MSAHRGSQVIVRPWSDRSRSRHPILIGRSSTVRRRPEDPSPSGTRAWLRWWQWATEFATSSRATPSAYPSRSPAADLRNADGGAFDPVGGTDFPKLIAALTFQGIAYIYGALSEDDTPTPALELIRKMPPVKQYSIRLVTGVAERRKVALQDVTNGLASGALTPVIARTFKFAD